VILLGSGPNAPIHSVALQQDAKHQSVRDEKQRYDESWNEEGGAQLTRQEAGLVALVEGLACISHTN
jgi:hypothetical protein